MSLHLSREGLWQACEAESCPLPYHVPDMPLAEAEQLPDAFLDQVFASVAEPPLSGLFEGRQAKWWQDENAQLHRDFDRPAVVYEDGERAWYQHGQLHRGFDRPAKILPNGTQIWYQENLQHREHGPSLIATDGTQLWYQEGRQHRAEDDLPAAMYADGTLEWWANGKLHRESGPARILPEVHMEWYQDGQLHAYGQQPAVVHANGEVEYWRWGRREGGPDPYHDFEYIDIEFEGKALERDRSRGYRR